MSSRDALGIEELKIKLKSYRVGDIEGHGLFSDSDEGEMDDFVIRIGVFGPTGSGKSAIINTVSKILRSAEDEVAISQSAGGEGTKVFEEIAFDGFSMFDTRGFFNIDSKLEETEFFRILYGCVRAGEVIDRGARGMIKAASAGTAAYKLNKPPLKRQLHVVLWVIKGNDIRLTNKDYMDNLNFITSKLREEAITMITVVTHEDVLRDADNAVKQAKKVTYSMDYHTFLVENWVDDNEPDELGKTKVLRMIYTALGCGERSVKVRQTKRRRQEIQAKKFKKPTEDEDRN